MRQKMEGKWYGGGGGSEPNRVKKESEGIVAKRNGTWDGDENSKKL